MRILLCLLFSFSAFATNTGAIFRGGNILLLKPTLEFQTSATRIITGQNIDPTVTPFAGNPGDVLINNVTGEIYFKGIGGDTDWDQANTGGEAQFADWTPARGYEENEIAVVDNDLLSRARVGHTSGANWVDDLVDGNVEWISAQAVPNSVVAFPTLAINGTNFEIGAGEGIFVDYTNVIIPNITYVRWPADTCAIPVQDNWNVAYITDIGGGVGDLVCAGGAAPPSLYYDEIVLADFNPEINETSRASVNPGNPHQQFIDNLNFLGPLLDGGAFSGTAALTVQRAAGTMQSAGINSDSAQEPNLLQFIATSPATVFYADANGIIAGSTTAFDPVNYDPGGTGVIPLTNNRWAVQRFFTTIGGKIVILYAQAQYQTESEAINSIFTDGPLLKLDPSWDNVLTWVGAIAYQKDVDQTDGAGISPTTFVNCEGTGCGGGSGGGGGGAGGDFFGPASSVQDNIVTFADVTGKTGKDSGILVTDVVLGPTSVVDDRITTFDGTTGKLIQDSGVLITDIVTGPATHTNRGIPTWDGTSGKVLFDNTVTINSAGQIAGPLYRIGTAAGLGAFSNVNTGNVDANYALGQSSGGSTFINASNLGVINFRFNNDAANRMQLDEQNNTIEFDPGGIGGTPVLIDANKRLTMPSGVAPKIRLNGAVSQTTAHGFGVANAENDLTSWFPSGGSAVWCSGGIENCATGAATRLRIDGSGVLTINNSYSFPITDGANDQVLTTDGAGTLTFTSKSAGGGGTGDVVGPAGATGGNVAVFDGASGKLLQDGAINGDTIVHNTSFSTDNALTIFDGTNGKLIQNHPATMADNGVLTLLGRAGGGGQLSMTTSGGGAIQSIATGFGGPTYTIELPTALGTTGQVLSIDNTNGSNLRTEWVTPAAGGTGDVVGPSSSTDNAIARYDSTTGKLIQNSVNRIFDSGEMWTNGPISTGRISGTTGGIFYFANNSIHSVEIKAPETVTVGSYIITLPPDAPLDGEILQSDGSGELSWVSSGLNMANRPGGAPAVLLTANFQTTGFTNNVDTQFIRMASDNVNPWQVGSLGSAQPHGSKAILYADVDVGALSGFIVPNTEGAAGGYVLTNSLPVFVSDNESIQFIYDEFADRWYEIDRDLSGPEIVVANDLLIATGFGAEPTYTNLVADTIDTCGTLNTPFTSTTFSFTAKRPCLIDMSVQGFTNQGIGVLCVARINLNAVTVLDGTESGDVQAVQSAGCDVSANFPVAAGDVVTIQSIVDPWQDSAVGGFMSLTATPL